MLPEPNCGVAAIRTGKVKTRNGDEKTSGKKATLKGAVEGKTEEKEKKHGQGEKEQYRQHVWRRWAKVADRSKTSDKREEKEQ